LIPTNLFTAFENECVISKENKPVYHIQGEKANKHLIDLLKPTAEFVDYVPEGWAAHLEYLSKTPYLSIDKLATIAYNTSQKLLSTTKDL